MRALASGKIFLDPDDCRHTCNKTQKPDLGLLATVPKTDLQYLIQIA